MSDKFSFDPKYHTYWLGDRQAPSVTRILKHSGLVDASFYSKGYSGENFLKRGTMIHEWTADVDSGKGVDMRKVPKRWRGFLEAWEKFKVETKWESSVIEHRVHCDDPLYAGTLDRIGRFPRSKVPVVLDIKNHNSGRVQQATKYQLVAYGHAYDPKQLFERVGVALHPDGSYAVTTFPLTDWFEDLETFLFAVRQRERSVEQLSKPRQNILLRRNK